MFRNRVVVVLLLHRAGLYKTRRFRKPSYVGDPINAVRIFSERGADEVVLLDIDASAAGRGPDFDTLRAIAEQSFVPMGYGGGIRSVQDAERLIAIGFEKVVINSALRADSGLLAAVSSVLGRQSVVASLDVNRDVFGRLRLYDHVRRRCMSEPADAFIRRAGIDEHAGELLVNAVHRDGMMAGYDPEVVALASSLVSLPVVVCGGAGSLDDVAALVRSADVSAAAGSIFVYYGPHRAVLVNYPAEDRLERLFGDVS